MRIEKRIELCKNLTLIERQIASYILMHQEEVANFSIQQFADVMYVSKSTIHRFCRKIQLKGFNELKVEMAKDSFTKLQQGINIDVNYPFKQGDSSLEISYQLMKLYELTIKDTFDILDKQRVDEIAKLLNQASVIDIYTHSHNQNVADNFQDKMLTIGRKVECPNSFYKQRLHALSSNQKHIALMISYSGSATFILPIAKKLYEMNTEIILIGKVGCNHYPQYIKYTLEMSDKESLQNRISQFASHIAVQYTMDTLFGCIYNLDRERNIDYIKDTIDYMDDRKND